MNTPNLPNLTEPEIMRFESSLSGKDPLESLRQFALELSAQGLRRREVYLTFLAFYVQLQAAGRDDEEALLGDVMDMISDSFSRDNPNNMNLPA